MVQRTLQRVPSGFIHSDDKSNDWFIILFEKFVPKQVFGMNYRVLKSIFQTFVLQYISNDSFTFEVFLQIWQNYTTLPLLERCHKLLAFLSFIKDIFLFYKQIKSKKEMIHFFIFNTLKGVVHRLEVKFKKIVNSVENLFFVLLSPLHFLIQNLINSSCFIQGIFIAKLLIFESAWDAV